MYFHDCEIRDEAEHYCIDFACSKIKCLIYGINASTSRHEIDSDFYRIIGNTKVNKDN